MKRISQLLFVCCLVLAAHPLGADEPKSTKSTSTKPAPKSDSPVLVIVNGQSIKEAELEFFARTLKLTTDEAPLLREQMLEQLIDRQLVRAFLAQRKVSASPELSDALLTRLKTRLKDRGEDFDKLLAKSGFTETTLRNELRLPLDWDAHVKLEVTDAKLRDVWMNRRYEFDGSEVRAAHIALKSKNPADDEDVLRELRIKILDKTISFADAAKKHSQAPSNAKGGDLGRFGFRGRQPPPYPQVAFGLKIGEVSEPFRSPFGVHLLTVTERIEGQLSLEDARPEILKQLSTELQSKTLQQERAKAKIERIKS